ARRSRTSSRNRDAATSPRRFVRAPNPRRPSWVATPAQERKSTPRTSRYPVRKVVCVLATWSLARVCFRRALRLSCSRNHRGRLLAISNGLPAAGSRRSGRFIAASHGFPPAAEFAHAVDRLILRFIICPGQHFADQSRGDELNS